MDGEKEGGQEGCQAGVKEKLGGGVNGVGDREQRSVKPCRLVLRPVI